VLFEFAAEVFAAVEADVADEPEAIVEGDGLLRELRGGAGAEEGEDEAGAGLRGDVGGVWAAEGECCRHALKEWAVGRSAACGDDTYEATHRFTLGRGWFSTPAIAS